MARLARAVFPGIAHHPGLRRGRLYPAGERAGADLLQRRRLCGLSRADGRAGRAGRRRSVVVGADAQPRASDPGPIGRGWPQAHAGAAAPALCRPGACAAEADGAFLAGPVRLRGDGRGAPGRGAALCGDEPGAGAPWFAGRRPGPGVERARAPGPGRGRRRDGRGAGARQHSIDAGGGGRPASGHGEAGQGGDRRGASSSHPARQPPPADLLRRRRLCGLPRDDGRAGRRELHGHHSKHP